MNSLFQNKGLRINGVIHLTPKDAYDLCINGAVAVDIREEYELDYKLLDVPESIFIANTKFKTTYEILSKTRALIIVDTVGLRSKDAVIFLQEQGYTNVANLNGGLVDWDKDKLPMKVDKYAELSGSCACMLKPMRKIKIIKPN
ncbi:MAG: rhodanese-like domain-containing protein [Bacteroidota bacterium]|jgi:rhodanese-related sulfurtransferase